MPHFAIILLQIASILLTARLVGWLFKKIHQPQVIGEMAAGILLGPSFFGYVAPDLSALLFPPATLGSLNVLSQLGVLLFMLLVGLELRLDQLQERGRAVLVISQASIVVPFCLGLALAFYLYPRLSSSSVPFNHFALFFGVAMSITALPVLARILAEHRLLQTPLGVMAIACAAVQDVTAWCILSAVLVVVRAGEAMLPLWITLLGSAAYLGTMWFGVRPLLRRVLVRESEPITVSEASLALILLLLLLSASVTEWLGIHALFGAFFMGVILPKERCLEEALTGRLEALILVLFLPLFFALSGLRTSLALLGGLEMGFYCGLIVLVAVIGKVGGALFSARSVGLPWREATAIGILMNTRGLMELIILNMGLELGVISPTLFSMMVLMALVTTFMTSPLLVWVYAPSLPAEWKSMIRR